MPQVGARQVSHSTIQECSHCTPAAQPHPQGPLKTGYVLAWEKARAVKRVPRRVAAARGASTDCSKSHSCTAWKQVAGDEDGGRDCSLRCHWQEREVCQ